MTECSRAAPSPTSCCCRQEPPARALPHLWPFPASLLGPGQAGQLCWGPPWFPAGFMIGRQSRDTCPVCRVGPCYSLSNGVLGRQRGNLWARGPAWGSLGSRKIKPGVSVADRFATKLWIRFKPPRIAGLQTACVPSCFLEFMLRNRSIFTTKLHKL